MPLKREISFFRRRSPILQGADSSESREPVSPPPAQPHFLVIAATTKRRRCERSLLSDLKRQEEEEWLGHEKRQTRQNMSQPIGENRGSRGVNVLLLHRGLGYHHGSMLNTKVYFPPSYKRDTSSAVDIQLRLLRNDRDKDLKRQRHDVQLHIIYGNANHMYIPMNAMTSPQENLLYNVTREVILMYKNQRSVFNTFTLLQEANVLFEKKDVMFKHASVHLSGANLADKLICKGPELASPQSTIVFAYTALWGEHNDRVQQKRRGERDEPSLPCPFIPVWMERHYGQHQLSPPNHPILPTTIPPPRQTVQPLVTPTHPSA
ncbi:hypothetical protein JOB18_026927 [Solea senegalensis]|uniref:Uncharacterized protein n=1 Tax=Solea senegalensis TaxID=28829 RepID=A0AAV6Q9E3_SOLSE|nr:hypothetical protein JOB18_026927 [Solea senegalensis]